MVIVFAKILIYIFSNYPGTLSYLETILRIKEVPGTIMIALPLAYAMGSILNFFSIWILFKKDFLTESKIKISTCFVESLVGAVTMGIISYLFLGIFDGIFNINTGMGIFLQGFLSGVLGIIFGIFVLILLKNKELGDIINAVKNKFWYKNIVAEGQPDL